MSDVRDLDVVVLAPEEGGESARDGLAEHVASGDLTVALGDGPVFDADGPLTRIGPASDVTRCEHTRRARRKMLIYDDAVIDREPGALGDLHARPHADA